MLFKTPWVLHPSVQPQLLIIIFLTVVRLPVKRIKTQKGIPLFSVIQAHTTKVLQNDSLSWNFVINFWSSISTTLISHTVNCNIFGNLCTLKTSVILLWTSCCTPGSSLVPPSVLAFLRFCLPSTWTSEGHKLAPYFHMPSPSLFPIALYATSTSIFKPTKLGHAHVLDTLPQAKIKWSWFVPASYSWHDILSHPSQWEKCPSFYQVIGDQFGNNTCLKHHNCPNSFGWLVFLPSMLCPLSTSLQLMATSDGRLGLGFSFFIPKIAQMKIKKNKYRWHSKKIVMITSYLETAKVVNRWLKCFSTMPACPQPQRKHLTEEYTYAFNDFSIVICP